MATRETFTAEEWQDLQWCVMLAGSHVTASDWPGLWKSFTMAAGASRYLTAMQSSDNALVAALCRDQSRRRPPDVTDRSSLAGEAAIDRIRRGVRLVADKAPEDLEDVTTLLVTIAEVVAEEVDGVSGKESEAVERVRLAVAAEAGGQA